MPLLNFKAISILPISIFCLLSLSFLGGCTSSSKNSGLSERKKEKIIQKSTQQKIYFYPYESVWRAAQLALRYPISVNNMDTGILETDWIKAHDGFINPDEVKPPSAGIRYKIIFQISKGKFDGKDSVRINIVKNIEKLTDFFSDPESLPSDGLEEKVLFYRIDREVLIEEGLKKSSSLK